MIEVIDVDEGSKPLSLYIEMSDGAKGEIDFSEMIKTDKYFCRLDTVKKFHAFGLEYGTLIWADGLDIAPEWIRENMKLTAA